MKEFIPKNLPLSKEIETTKVLKKTISVNRTLAKLSKKLENIEIMQSIQSIQIKNSKFFINIKLYAMLKKLNLFNIDLLYVEKTKKS